MFLFLFVFIVVKRFQSYVDPEEPSVAVGEEEGVALPLGDTTLTNNLGVPIIVICCKVSILFRCISLTVSASLCVYTYLLTFIPHLPFLSFFLTSPFPSLSFFLTFLSPPPSVRLRDRTGKDPWLQRQSF